MYALTNKHFCFSKKGVMETVENACVEFYQKGNRSESEYYLIAFKNSPNALNDSFQLLLHSKVSFAQFHAAGAIRELIIRKWKEFSMQEKQQMKKSLVDIVVHSNVHITETFVKNQLYYTISFIYKRGWLDGENSVQELNAQFIDNGNNLHHIKILTNIVSAFDIGKAAGMEMPLEFHTNAKIEFGKLGILTIGKFAFNALNNVAGSISTINILENRVEKGQKEYIQATVELCLALSQWQYCADKVSLLSWNAVESNSVVSSFHPGKEWKEVLVQQQLIDGIFNLYIHLRQIEDCTVSVQLRKLLIQIASLDGCIFEPSQVKITYMECVLKTGIVILANPLLDHISKSAAQDIEERAHHEIIDMCQLMVMVISNLSISDLAIADYLPMLVHELSSLSCKLLTAANSQLQNANHLDVILDDIWQMQAFDILLEGWTKLSSVAWHVAENPSTASNVLQAFQEHCVSVVHEYLVTKLTIACIEAASEEEEDDEIDIDAEIIEQNEVVATIARLVAIPSLEILCRLTVEKFTPLQTAISQLQLSNSKITVELAQAMEQICFLVQMIGMVLADSTTSERPHIPCMLQVNDGNSHIVVEAITSVLQVLDFESKRVDSNSSSSLLSPSVSEELLRSSSRIAAAFVAPNMESRTPPSLLSAFAISNSFDSYNRLTIRNSHNDIDLSVQGNATVQFLLQVSYIYLSKWPTEPVITHEVCELLTMLSRSKAAIVAIMLPAWKTIMKANATSLTFLSAAAQPEAGNEFCRLPSEVRGSLTEALCRMGFSNKDASNAYSHLNELINTLESRLKFVMEELQRAPKEAKNNVQLQERIKLIISMYSGVALSAECSTCSVISGFCTRIMPHFVLILDVFYGNAQVACGVFQYFCNVAEAQLAYFEPNDEYILFKSSNDLVRTYAKHNIGVRHRMNDDEDKFPDVLKILDLLSFLLAKDGIDFSDVDDDQHPKLVVSDVVYSSLGYLIPLMTEGLLQIPEVCLHFFNVVSYTIDSFPFNLATIESKTFSMFIEAINFGLKSVHLEIARNTLEALASLATFHAKAIHRGKPGLGIHLQQNEQMLVHFFQLCIQHLFREELPSSLLDNYASALFPIIHCEQVSRICILPILRFIYATIATILYAHPTSIISTRKCRKPTTSIITIQQTRHHGWSTNGPRSIQSSKISHTLQILRRRSPWVYPKSLMFTILYPTFIFRTLKHILYRYSFQLGNLRVPYIKQQNHSIFLRMIIPRLMVIRIYNNINPIQDHPYSYTIKNQTLPNLPSVHLISNSNPTIFRHHNRKVHAKSNITRRRMCSNTRLHRNKYYDNTYSLTFLPNVEKKLYANGTCFINPGTLRKAIAVFGHHFSNPLCSSPYHILYNILHLSLIKPWTQTSASPNFPYAASFCPFYSPNLPYSLPNSNILL